MENTLAREFSPALELPSIFCDCTSTLEPEVEGNRSLGPVSCIVFLLLLTLTNFLRQLSLHLPLAWFWAPQSWFQH